MLLMSQLFIPDRSRLEEINDADKIMTLNSRYGLESTGIGYVSAKPGE